MLKKLMIVSSVSVLLIGCGTINRNVSTYVAHQDREYRNSPVSRPFDVPASMNSEAIRDHYLVPAGSESKASNDTPSLMPPQDTDVASAGQ